MKISKALAAASLLATLASPAFASKEEAKMDCSDPKHAGHEACMKEMKKEGAHAAEHEMKK